MALFERLFHRPGSVFQSLCGVLSELYRSFMTSTRTTSTALSLLPTLKHPLEECHDVGWRRHGARVVEGARGDEERPSVELLAQLRQALEVEHLTNGNTPAGKAVVVHGPLVVAVGTHFE